MTRTQWLVSTAALVGSVAWGCAMLPENIGHTSEALEAGFLGSNNLVNSNEVWSAWSPGLVDPNTGAPGPDTLVMGYNVSNTAQGWAWSDDQGHTWNPRSTSSIDAGAGTIIRSDPVMVADHLGNVVFVDQFISAASQAKAPDGGLGVTDQDIAMVSNDGGRTFKSDHLAIVNDGATCADGIQDQPAAAFDYTTTPPTLWVAFRHRGGAGGSLYGACVRRGFINPAIGNRITWLEDAFEVQNFHGEDGTGIGAILIQAGDGAVTVVYTNTDATPNNCSPAAPPTSLNSFATEALTSFDNGHTWQTKSRLFHTDNGPTWAACVLNSKVQMGASIRNFGYVRAPDGTHYVIAQYSQWQARLFKSRLQGAGSNSNTDGAWSEWCPGTATADGGPVSNWTPVGVQCPQEKWTFVRADPPSQTCAPGNGSILAKCALAWPTIAADDQDRVVLYYYESDDTNQFFHLRVWSNSTPRSATSSWQSTIVVEQSPVTLADDAGDFDPFPIACADGGCGTRALGDYEGMAVRFGFAAPVCGQAGTFFPTFGVAFGTQTSFEQSIDITP